MEAYLPAGHVWQDEMDVAPLMVLTDPEGQGLQDADPDSSLKLPEGQG